MTPRRRKKHKPEQPEQIVAKLRDALASESGQGPGNGAAGLGDQRGDTVPLASRAPPRSGGLGGMKSKEATRLNWPRRKSSGRVSTTENRRFSRELRSRDRIPAIQQAVYPQPVKTLEDENRRLKQLVADQTPDIQLLEHLSEENA